MSKTINSLSLILPLVSGIFLLSNHTLAAANSSVWQPQISEKILMLPSKHLENAVERDFASPLANDMQTLDEDIQSKWLQSAGCKKISICMVSLLKLRIKSLPASVTTWK